MAAGPYSWPRAKPGAGGVNASARAQPAQKSSYGKGGSAAKYPAKKPGMSGDTRGKGSALTRKEKK